MKKYFYITSLLLLLTLVGSNAFAGITNLYVRVERGAGCGSNPINWVSTTNLSSWGGGLEAFYTPSSFPTTEIDGVRIAVGCDGCQLAANNWYWFNAATYTWNSTCDLEGYHSPGIWRMEQRSNICNQSYTNEYSGPGGSCSTAPWGYVSYFYYGSSGWTQKRYWTRTPIIC